MNKLNHKIPGNWKTKSFGEVFEFLPTLTLSRADLISDELVSGIYNIHYGDIHSTYNYTILDFDIEKKVPKIVDQDLDEANLTLLKDGDIVIADASEDYEGVGTCIELQNVGQRKVTAGLHTFAAREKSNQLVNGFKGYLFKHPWVRNELKKLATGSKVYGVSKSNIAELELVIPSLPEQQKIASIFSKWDETIETQTQLIEAKEKQKKGLMQKLLTGEVRFPGFEQEWKFDSIGNILKIRTGKKDTQNKEEYGEYPFFVRSNYVERISSFSFDGESVLTSGDGVGVGKIFHYINGKFDYHQRVYNIHGFNEKIDGRYFYYYFSNHFFQRVMSMTAKNSVDSVRMEMISDMLIPIPSIDEQKKVATFLTCTDNEIQSLKIELEAMKLQKKGLMQELLTGKIRVTA